MTARPALDVSHLPRYVFGPRSIVWWGTMGLVAIEGTMFAIVMASYFYLRTRVGNWPPNQAPPYLLWGIINTSLFVISEAPNLWLRGQARAEQLKPVRVGLLIVTAFGLANLIVRIFEFPAMNCTWSQNAYASIVWLLLGLHTAHLLTDWVDSVVLTLLVFKGPVERKRFVDVSENCDYWSFVVVAWLPIFVVLYLAPRFL